MPFGLKQTTGISSHYSEAQSGSMWKSSEDVEDKWEVRKTCRSEWKTREGPEGVGKGQKRLGRLWESAEEMGRHGNVMLHYR